MIRFLSALAFAGALVLPSSAAAAPGDGVPLRTLCSSPTMEFCVSFWTWDYTATLAGNAVRQDFISLVTLFGSAYDQDPAPQLRADIAPEGITSARLQGSLYSPDESGFYSLREGTFVGLSTLYGQTSTPLDIRALSFGGAGCSTVIVTCYDVPVELPEPGTWLLLASGLGGVALVGWRRRRAAY